MYSYRLWVGYETKRTFYICSYLRGHWSFTPSVLKLTTSPSFAKLVTWMNVTLLSGLFTRIVIDYSSTSVHFIYLRMFHCIHVCILCNCNHLRFVMWLNKEIWWWWWWSLLFSRSRAIVVAHQNLNGSHDLTTPLSRMFCHPWARTCYYQPAYRIWSLYLYPLWRYEKGFKMWKMRWFGVVRSHPWSLKILPFDTAHK